MQNEKYTPLSMHKKKKGKLITPLSKLNIELTEWERDYLPEHLWIELLCNEYGEPHWVSMYNEFLDKLEVEINDNSLFPLYGLITDFDIIPEESRSKFIDKNEKLIFDLFYIPIGKILTFYPDNPANWLILKKWTDCEKIDFEVELNKLGESIKRLMKSDDLYSGHIRAVLLNRLFKHNKLKIFKNLDIVELIPKYSNKSSIEENQKVQAFAKNTLRLIFHTTDIYKSKKWPMYFWRQNYNLVPCVAHTKSIDNENALSDEQLNKLRKSIERILLSVTQYLDKVALQYKYDLYDSTKDEILLGLFSRLTRLFIVFISEPSFWAKDISGIFLRCLVDTLITFGYLTLKGDNKDFENFIKYSEGKEKLLMLQLQDNHNNSISIDGESAHDISNNLGGGINPELIDIDFRGWTNKIVLTLAKESGLDDYYKLIYDPASSDLHGSWISIKKTNLTYCKMSLHRYHKMPSYVEPPLFINYPIIAKKIYEKSVEIAINHLKFPKIDNSFEDLNFF